MKSCENRHGAEKKPLEGAHPFFEDFTGPQLKALVIRHLLKSATNEMIAAYTWQIASMHGTEITHAPGEESLDAAEVWLSHASRDDIARMLVLVAHQLERLSSISGLCLGGYALGAPDIEERVQRIYGVVGHIGNDSE